MSVARNRLLSLIDFSHQSARLRSKPSAAVSAHGLLALYEHELQGLPGIQINENCLAGDDEVWLAVDRLFETRPPDITDALLRPWVQIMPGPIEEPRLRDALKYACLIAEGTHHSAANLPEQGEGEPVIDPDTMIMLDEYENFAQVKAQFTIYLNAKWHPWAKEEKLRRKTIRIYSRFFALKQQLEGGIVEAQLELIWGVGFGIWNFKGTTVNYPLVGRPVEMSLNPATAAIEIRPRDVDARIELDWYASVDNPGVATLEQEAKAFFAKATTTFSPFDRGTFEPLLRMAATNLDSNGIYWPNEVSAEDRTLPKADDKLKVTDTWVLFARPRNNDLFLQDLEKLKQQVEETDTYPPVVTAVVTDPDTINRDVEPPSFRGVSVSCHSERSTSGKKVHDLYFPKAFNDEQVRIIQLLEISDGVVVQGPPGTGKTHTIANIICHYLAEGKRVLVTSMKDPALAVLQEQIPKEIRPLAISLLTTEQEGMKQFEHAINKIASEVQSLDRNRTAREIHHLEESIDALHGTLTSIDRKIGEWAQRNLAKITLEAEEFTPQDAAQEVVRNTGQFEWIPDLLGIAPVFAPQITDTDVVQLREARRALGQDIDYLDASLPQIVAFPNFKTFLEVHQNLSQFEKLKQGVESGVVPVLANSSQETFALAQKLLNHIGALQRLRDKVLHARRPWTVSMREHLRQGTNNHFLPMLEALGAELEQADERRKVFVDRPVTMPADVELDAELIEAVRNLTEGKSPFGLRGLFGKSTQKQHLDSIRVLGSVPANPDDWKHVAEYLALLKRLRELTLRWNAIAHEIGLEEVSENWLGGGLSAVQVYTLYRNLKEEVRMERVLCTAAAQVFPHWVHVRDVAFDTQRLVELVQALKHHLAKHRLANAFVAKERLLKVLEGRTGRVVGDLRRFLVETIGKPEIEDARMQSEWSTVMAELSRVLGLEANLNVVRDVCEKFEAAGAVRYATLLKQPLDGVVDHLLPDNWRKAWRLRRLATHLESIDAQKALKRLAKDRDEVGNALSQAYRDIVVKRTWLKLAENASHSIRSALQAYLSAIQKIGKGTGKRAVRYRQDARRAALQANHAIPCWIMPHYRVSESLPAALGCFDLVIIDEASQSDLTALPSLLRAQKVLIVGDDKQVSPEGVGLEEEKICSIMSRFLGNQVEIYRAQMSPERSIYDLFKVVFAKSTVMLKEHFRCVGPIIEYSKREFYNHELRPLRMPKSSERLDPPLIDVLVDDGYRKGDVNRPEARFIVNEIKAIVADQNMSGRSIGVVSLLADKQAITILDMLLEELGPETVQNHRIACGDARTFQGKERDIMFLSMVSAPNEVGAPLSRDTSAQRFNVAASRARDRMYLVRSVTIENLSQADRLRRNLIKHFSTPFAQDEARVDDLRKLCESSFEGEMYDELTQRGYWVTPQVKVGQYRIDIVVEGHNDARLAIECDGDKYHGADKWADDMQRQRVLERAGWAFWRCFASAFIRRRQEVLEDLLQTLAERGIEPIGAEGAPRSVHTEYRAVSSSDDWVTDQNPVMFVEVIESAQTPISETPPEQTISEKEDLPPAETPFHQLAGDLSADMSLLVSTLHPRDTLLPYSNYVEYVGPPGDDPRSADMHSISEGIVMIVKVEGPMLAKRACDIYLRGCGIKRMGPEIRTTMKNALMFCIHQQRLVSENETTDTDPLLSIIRVSGSPPIKLRTKGSRLFEEIPPSELLVVAMHLLSHYNFQSGSDEHLRLILQCFGLKRLTAQVGTTLLGIIERRFPYVDEFLIGMAK